ncbi:MAG: ABC transporter permease [Pseudobutyrivibrio sp.]|nr:ABC transporter permease [Pseudobutyrivibrio sp.]
MIALELKKEKRTGLVAILFLTGIIGALYVFLNYKIRGNTLLNMPLDPMDVLLTQLYGMIMVLNMFAIVIATSIAYNMEFSGFAIKKMYVLPISMWKVFVAKFLIITSVFFIAIVIQNAALMCIGISKLGSDKFDMGVFLMFVLYSYITSLPVISFMLMIASLFENLWVTIGIGVAGFLSAVALQSDHAIYILSHPFIVMFKPAVAMTAKSDLAVALIAIFETVVFFVIGIVIAENKKSD